MKKFTIVSSTAMLLAGFILTGAALYQKLTFQNNALSFVLSLGVICLVNAIFSLAKMWRIHRYPRASEQFQAEHDERNILIIKSASTVGFFVCSWPL